MCMWHTLIMNAQSVFIILSLSGQHGHIFQTFSSIRNMKLTVLQFSSSLSAAGTGSCRRGMTLTQRHWTIIIKMSCSVKFCFRLLQSQPFHYLFSSLILLRTVCVLLSLSNKHRVSKKSNFVEGTRSGLETKVLWTNLLEHIEPLTQFSQELWPCVIM